METKNPNIESKNTVYTVDIQLQNIFMPELKGYEDILLNLNTENYKAPMSDLQYINDKEYVVSVAQF
jgi:hypothetical protein